MSKSINVDFVTRQIEVDTDGKEYYVSAAVAAKDAEQSMLNAQNAAISVQKYKALWFDSVAAMKAEPSLTAGAYVCTAGYYEPNDGGGASYLIRDKTDTDTDDGGSVHTLQNNLVAELIVENGTVRPEQFGAVGDGVSDDTYSIQKAIDFLHSFGRGIVEFYSDIYKVIPQGDDLPAIYGKSNVDLVFKGKIKLYSEQQITTLLCLQEVENIKIYNPYFEQVTNFEETEFNHGIKLTSTKNISIYNANIENFHGDGIVFGYSYTDASLSYNENFYADVINIRNVWRNGITCACCSNSFIGILNVYNVTQKPPKAAIDFEIEKANMGIGITIDTINSYNCDGGVNVIGGDNSEIMINIGNINFKSKGFVQIIDKDTSSKTVVNIKTMYVENVEGNNLMYISGGQITVEEVIVKASSFDALCYAIYRAHGWITIKHVSLFEAVFNFLYRLSNYYSLAKDGKKHFFLYGIEGIANKVELKAIVEWLNVFSTNFVDQSSDSPILNLNTAIAGNFNKVYFGGSERIFKILDGGSIKMYTDSTTLTTLNTVDSWVKIKLIEKDDSNICVNRVIDYFMTYN